ncbi:MAG TPA: zf-HC2 domain-containing protein, partial [Actinomycetota bacterium]|nr:zf-HC2 domain-containing protein [Actinomycetota bacterium]
MRTERTCDEIRIELSARLDGEVGAEVSRAIDDHLATCSECRTYEARLTAVRQTMRVRALEEDVPDLTPAVMRRVRELERPARDRSGDLLRFRLRIAAVAAAAMALVVFGASLPFTNSPADIATASEIGENVQNAARMLEAYEASFEIVERGWHEDVRTRRFTAQVWYRAPEDIHVQVTDRTEYPSREWPTNDYEMIANPERWWIEERSACPTEGLPACPRPYIVEGPVDDRASLDR